MKTLFAYLFIISFASAEIQTIDIIPNFFKLLHSKDAPTDQDERNFFGGKSCDPVRIMISSNEKYLNYSKSKTPIWSLLRDKRQLFSTLNLDDLSATKVVLSNPMEMTRLEDGHKMAGKKVVVTFPTEIVNKPGGSKGTSVGIFTLGSDCYVEIGKTMIIFGNTKVLLSELIGN